MKNLERSISGVVVLALGQPGSAHVILFKDTLQCVKVHADLNMMAQYRYHMSETMAYMEDYLYRFHKTKDILLEYGVTKHKRTKIDEQPIELRHDSAQSRECIAPSKQRRNLYSHRKEDNK